VKLSEKDKLRDILARGDLLSMDYDAYASGLERIKKETSEGVEYWMARELMPLLDYTKWANFCGVIEKAKIACEAAGMKTTNHFADVGNMVLIGSGAQRERGDWYLTRFACYLIAMNADPSKPEVGFAMTYFAAQTRRQELLDRQLTEADKRVDIRMRLWLRIAASRGLQRKPASSGTLSFKLPAIAVCMEWTFPKSRRARGSRLATNSWTTLGRSNSPRTSSRPT
jgi:hypothetical protein